MRNTRSLVLLFIFTLLLLSTQTVYAAEDGVIATIGNWLGSFVPNVSYWTSGAFLISIAGYFLAFGGWMLNLSIEMFVVNMGDALRGSVGNAIVDAWTIIRDIINLTFVFGLIYIAFLTVIKASTHDLKHAVPKILMYAILINFSLFFAKIIIDFSNVASIQVYELMRGTFTNTSTNYGISGYFMERLGLLHLFDPNAVTSQGAEISKNLGTEFGLGFSLAISILMIIAMFIFTAGAILIAVRFVIVVFLLVLSPVAFASGFIPKLNTEEWAHSWWKNMISQAIFAPAYLLMLYIAMQVANSSVFQNTGQITSVFTAGEDLAALVNIIAIFGFLIGALIVAKMAGAYFASSTINLGKSMARGATGSVFGGAARLGRVTIGQRAAHYAHSDNLKEAAAGGGVRGFMARRALSTSHRLETASFDARQVGGIGKKYGLGEGRTGGWKKSVETVKEQEKKYAESLGTVDDKDPRVVALKELVEHEEHALQKLKNQREAAKARGESDKMDLLDEKIHEQEKKIKGSKEAVEREKNRRQVGRAVTPAEVAELAAKNDDLRYTQSELKKAKAKLSQAKEAYTHATSPEEREAAIKQIGEAQDAIKHLEEMQEQTIDTLARSGQGQRGYAGYMDAYASSKILSWSLGRTRSMNREAAKAIREAKKKAKKEEKKAKAKDDHGGGDDKKDDDHGDEHH